MKQSDSLTLFYRAYLKWVEAGAPDDNRYDFVTDCGLCYNARRYDSTLLVRYEMKSQFATAGLDDSMPFVDDSAYSKDSDDFAHHFNPVRMRWVREHAAIPLSTEV